MHKIFSVIGLAAALSAAPAVAVPLVSSGVDAGLGRVTVLHITHPVELASVVDPKLADVRIVDGRTIAITGKSVGASTLIMSNGPGKLPLSIAVTVGNGEMHQTSSKDPDVTSYVCGTTRCIRAAVVKPALRVSSAVSEN